MNYLTHPWSGTAERLSLVICKTIGYSDGHTETTCRAVTGALRWIDGFRVVFNDFSSALWGIIA